MATASRYILFLVYVSNVIEAYGSVHSRLNPLVFKGVRDRIAYDAAFRRI